MSYIKYTKELLSSIVLQSKSFADVCRFLQLKPSSGSQSHISKRIKEFKINTSHFTGKNWSISAEKIKNFKPIEYYLTKNSNIKSHRLLKKLIICGMKQRKCENCGSTNWLDKPINLELHHIDHDHSNNKYDNLQILCPNCHSYHHNKKVKLNANKILKSSKKKIISVFCPKCGKKIKSTSFICIDCYRLFRKEISSNFPKKTKINWPSKDFIIKELETKSFLQLSKELGVSDNAIRKHLKNN